MSDTDVYPGITTQPAKKKLRHNVEMFCQYFAESRNAKQSYKRAYAKNKVSNGSCATLGCKMLTNIHVRERITVLMGEQVLDAHITPVKILNEYADLAFSNLADMVDNKYNLKPLNKLTAGQKKSIKKLKKTINKRFNKEGDCIGTTEIIEVELFDRQKALDSLAQYTGILNPDTMVQIFTQINNQNTNVLTVNPDEIPIDLLEKLIKVQSDKQENKGLIEHGEK